MSFKVLSVCGLSIALVSCTVFDPEYAKYKKEQQEKAKEETPQYGDPYSNIENPYGVPSGSPQPSGEVGQYRPEPNNPPYQPLPGVPSNPNYPTIPSNSPSGYTPPATVSTHVVAKGDSLWGLSRKYGASVDAIRQANGLTNNLIRVGQTLQIPR